MTGTEQMSWSEVQSLTKIANTPVSASPVANKIFMRMPQNAHTSREVNSVPGE